MRALGFARTLAIASAALACAPGSGSSRLKEVRGQVVDLDTGAPIGGAEVVEWYHGGGLSDVQPVRHARFTTANARGEFHFPSAKAGASSALFKTYGPTYSFYHPDYGLVRAGGPEDGFARLQGSRARAALAHQELRPYCNGGLSSNRAASA